MVRGSVSGDTQTQREPRHSLSFAARAMLLPHRLQTLTASPVWIESKAKPALRLLNSRWPQNSTFWSAVSGLSCESLIWSVQIRPNLEYGLTSSGPYAGANLMFKVWDFSE